MQKPEASQLKTNVFWLVLISSLAGLLFFSQGWLMASKEEKPFNGTEQFAWAMTGWYLWAALFPFIYKLSGRLTLDRSKRLRSVSIHLVVALALSCLHVFVQMKLTNWIPYVNQEPYDTNMLRGYVIGMVMWRMVIYTAVVSVAYAVRYHRKYREGQVIASRMEARILRAQMEALKMQMDPDFLFETLHSIADLMHRDLSAADKMIARLGDFLRLTLDTSGTSVISMRKELEFLKCYLEIQKIRWNHPRQVDFDISPETLDACIPNLLLYSLVEEAVERRPATEQPQAPLRIYSKQSGTNLRLEISDANGTLTESPAVANLTARMQQIYNGEFRMLFEKSDDGSEKTIVEIPWTDSESSPESEWIQSSGPEEERGAELEWVRLPESVDSREEPARWWKPYLWSGFAFTLLGLFFFARETLTMWFLNKPINWVDQAKWFGMWYFWALAAPYIAVFSRWFPLERPFVLRHILFHVANSAFVLLVLSFLSLTYGWFLDPKAGPFWEHVVQEFQVSGLAVDIVLYWMIVSVGYAVASYREFRRGEFKYSRLRAQLARAQLQALKMQLHPHFLFNTLNSISELMQEEMETAEKMMSHLERFLRLTVENSEAQEVLLGTELEFLRCYLEIEHVRFQDRLSVNMEIEPQAMNVPVPNLLLQPIVENAIRHGIASLSTAGHIEIRASRTDGRLQVSIQDNGPGISEVAPMNRKGLGLSNTRERLQQLYGRKHRFELANAPEGGLIVTLEIPVETQA